MQSAITVNGTKVISALIISALIFGWASVASAATTITTTNNAIVTNTSIGVANSGVNGAIGGAGGSCGIWCSGGNGGAGIVITGKAKAKIKTINIVNTNVIIIP